MTCPVCDGIIPAERVRRGAATCSTPCARQRDRERRAARLEEPRGDRRRSGSTGARAELLVAADLLGRGFDVFRALASDCSCDLVVLVGLRAIRVEVRTGYLKAGGAIGWPCPPKDAGRSDYYGVVVRGQVWWFSTLDRRPVDPEEWPEESSSTG